MREYEMSEGMKSAIFGSNLAFMIIAIILAPIFVSLGGIWFSESYQSEWYLTNCTILIGIIGNTTQIRSRYTCTYFTPQWLVEGDFKNGPFKVDIRGNNRAAYIDAIDELNNKTINHTYPCYQQIGNNSEQLKNPYRWEVSDYLINTQFILSCVLLGLGIVMFLNLVPQYIFLIRSCK
jgi:hypothetical protein